MQKAIPFFQLGVCVLAAQLTSFAGDPIVEARVPDVGSDLSKLRIKKIVPIPLRLNVKEIRDGKLILGGRITTFSPGMLKQEEAIPSEILEVGDRIPRTNLVITRFAQKTRMNPATGEPQDVSEIGLRNTRTKVERVFLMGQVMDSDISAQLESSDGQIAFVVEASDKFEFPKGSGLRYEVVEIKVSHGVFLRDKEGTIFRIAMPQSAK